MTVSVIVTCHNEEKYIEQGLRSVTAQTAFDRVLEIIAVDDGSRDNSPFTLQQLAKEIKRLRIITTPGLGLPAARNRALIEARGKFVAILDGDDYWEAEKLERQLMAIEKDPRIGLVYSDFVDFSRDDATDARIITVRRFNPENPNHLRDYFIHDAPIVPSTVLVRRSVFKDVGLFDESLPVGEDTEFYLRVAEKWRFCHVPGAFAFKRRHAGQLSRTLEVLLPSADVITQRFCERHPELKPLARRRMARVHVKVSADFAIKGEWLKALRHAVKTLRRAPLYPRGWANLALLLAPAPLVRLFYRSVKRPWHAIRQMGAI
jgi:glycosyltransferase involved in cell wall biosynthesis